MVYLVKQIKHRLNRSHFENLQNEYRKIKYNFSNCIGGKLILQRIDRNKLDNLQFRTHKMLQRTQNSTLFVVAKLVRNA